MGTPEGTISIIDTVSQNNLNTIEKHKILCKFWKIGSGVFSLSEKVLDVDEPYPMTP